MHFSNFSQLFPIASKKYNIHERSNNIFIINYIECLNSSFCSSPKRIINNDEILTDSILTSPFPLSLSNTGTQKCKVRLIERGIRLRVSLPLCVSLGDTRTTETTERLTGRPAACQAKGTIESLVVLPNVSRSTSLSPPCSFHFHPRSLTELHDSWKFYSLFRCFLNFQITFDRWMIFIFIFEFEYFALDL